MKPEPFITPPNPNQPAVQVSSPIFRKERIPALPSNSVSSEPFVTPGVHGQPAGQGDVHDQVQVSSSISRKESVPGPPPSYTSLN